MHNTHIKATKSDNKIFGLDNEAPKKSGVTIFVSALHARFLEGFKNKSAIWPKIVKLILNSKIGY